MEQKDKAYITFNFYNKNISTYLSKTDNANEGRDIKLNGGNVMIGMRYNKSEHVQLNQTPTKQH